MVELPMYYPFLVMQRSGGGFLVPTTGAIYAKRDKATQRLGGTLAPLRYLALHQQDEQEPNLSVVESLRKMSIKAPKVFKRYISMWKGNTTLNSLTHDQNALNTIKDVRLLSIHHTAVYHVVLPNRQEEEGSGGVASHSHGTTAHLRRLVPFPA